jgi:hypothetical protein
MRQITLITLLAILMAGCNLPGGFSGDTSGDDISTNEASTPVSVDQTALPSEESPTEPVQAPTNPPDLETEQPSGNWWHPAPGLSWQWYLTDEEMDISFEADVYDIDLDQDQAVVEKLHARGVRVICYISVGSWENWREDADAFPDEVLGKKYEGWPDERWLDIRQIDLLAPIMRARLDECAAKGFDGVEPDNIEIYENATGFPLTYSDQLTYARWLADEAHARGLAIGIKNAPDMVADSLDFFDFAITEDCYFYSWCEDMLPFVDSGKLVLAAEYTDMNVSFIGACAWGAENGFSFILKDRDLTEWIKVCS